MFNFRNKMYIFLFNLYCNIVITLFNYSWLCRNGIQSININICSSKRVLLMIIFYFLGFPYDDLSARGHQLAAGNLPQRGGEGMRSPLHCHLRRNKQVLRGRQACSSFQILQVQLNSKYRERKTVSIFSKVRYYFICLMTWKKKICKSIFLHEISEGDATAVISFHNIFYPSLKNSYQRQKSYNFILL